MLLWLHCRIVHTAAASLSEYYLERLVIFLQNITPDSLHLDSFIREALEEIKHSSKKDISLSSSSIASAAGGAAGSAGDVITGSTIAVAATPGSTLLYIWGTVMTLILCYFVFSCLEQFAQYYQATLDKLKSDELRGMLPSKVLESLRSPTGLLRLPPPTARKTRHHGTGGLAEIPFQSLQLLYLKRAPKREPKMKDFFAISTTIK